MAKTYMVSYDLKANGQNYNDLSIEIEMLGESRKILTTTWVIKTEKSCLDILTKLKPYVDENDNLIVARLTNEIMWSGFSTELVKWLNPDL
jgi:hypothetical protein